jgi:hypothetical protein
MSVPTVDGSWGRLIPAKKVKWPNYYTCVCGNDSCKVTTAVFRELNDIRGHMVAMPAVTKDSARTNIATIKAKKLGRWRSHLRIGTHVIDKISDNRKRTHAAIDQSTTRSNDQEKNDL